LVTEIIPNTTAERIRLAPGDVLMTYDRERLTSKEQLIALIGLGGAESHVLAVLRGSEMLSFTVPAGRLGVYLQTRKAADGEAARAPLSQ
jgi:hypothetical protein